MTQGQKTTIQYDDRIVRWFMLASVIWGAVGMAAGVLIASQLNFWQMNGKFLEWITFGWLQAEGVEFLTFGRLRPLHTNAAIFAFVGNMMFAGIYHSTQRLCKCRMASDRLSWIHFWGWQLIIVAAAVTLPAGFTRGKEYAELIWPINLVVAAIWLVFAANFFWTLIKRNEPTLYVALWFYIATVVTVTMLYVVNHLSIPTGLLHSYPVFGGVQDALVQWWYGHNAVAFFLTTPILGIMYYYLPKAAGRPVYSYRLSIVHFWSLVFIYIWAGPHHLLNTALPLWLQALGMLFSLMLWAPSWGGMLNGLLTLRGAWNKVWTDPVLKFFVAGVTFYGMATFEGPLLSIRAVNTISHYTDWTIGHVHSGTLGWNGFMAAGMFYWMAPRLWNRKLYSTTLADLHFYTGMVGILLYVASMWVSGISQQLMLLATEEGGLLLSYPTFVETLNAIRPMMLTRLFGGGLYLLGWFLMCYNLFRTVWGAEPIDSTAEVYVEKRSEEDRLGPVETFFNPPVIYSLVGVIFATIWFVGGGVLSLAGLLGTITVALVAIVHFKSSAARWVDWYEKLLANSIPFTALVFVAVIIGGVVQILPTITVQRAANIEDRVQVPYTPLELAGRDIYIAEGCYNCHSQMVRTLTPEVLRYGHGQGYSRLGESIYDFPYQWGSKRTGPDLAREGGVRPNGWHFEHMLDPRAIEKDSNMPAYPWLYTKSTDYGSLPAKIRTMRLLGVPYPADWDEEEIIAEAQQQAEALRGDLESNFYEIESDKQIVALIAYLQKLGASEDAAAAMARLDAAFGESPATR